jgi:hypothetical protein
VPITFSGLAAVFAMVSMFLNRASNTINAFFLHSFVISIKSASVPSRLDDSKMISAVFKESFSVVHVIVPISAFLACNPFRTISAFSVLIATCSSSVYSRIGKVQYNSNEVISSVRNQYSVVEESVLRRVR